MKQTLFLLVLGLVVPTAALAQTGEEGAEEQPDEAEPAQTPSEDEGETDDGEAEGEPAEGEETSGDEGAEGTEDAEPAEGTDPVEQAEPTEQAEEEPEAEPEPEVSATAAAEAEAELTAPDAPSLADDLAAAQAEVERADEPEAEEEEPADEGPQLPWRNSLFLYDNEISTTTFDGGSSTLSYNPYWSMAFSFRPRWYFTDEMSLRLRQDLSVELTDTDLYPKNRRPVLADTIIDFIHSNLFEWEGIRLSGGPRISLPTSIASRAYEKYFALSLGAALSRPFEDVLEGAEVGLSTRYGYTFAGSNVRLSDDPVPQARAPRSPTEPGEVPEAQASGVTVADHEFVLAVSGTLSPIENLSLSTSFTWWWTNGRGVTPGCVDGVLTDPDGCHEVGDGSDTHLRLSTWFTLGASYQWLDWLGTELTYSHLTSEFAPDGARRNPFWSVDSTVALTATFTLDKMYQNFSGTGSSPAEVVEEESQDDGTARASAQTGAVAW